MSPGRSLRRAAGEAPDREAYVYRDVRLRYGDWQRLAERFGAGLLERGAVRGDRLAIVLPPRPEFAIAYLGAAAAGLVTAGVNPRLGNAEIEHVLRDSGARFAVVLDRFAGRDLGALVRSLAGGSAALGEVFLVEEAGVDLDGTSASPDSFGTLLRPPREGTLARLRASEEGLGPDEPVAIVYTSGTTGTPKGALFAVRNLEAVARTRGEMGTRRGERVLTAGTPFAHVGYMTKVTGQIEDLQTTIVHDSFNARRALETIADERVSQLGGVPAQWALMLRDPEFDRFDLSSLRAGVIGGAPFTPELIREIRARFRIPVTTRYSCTEIALGTGSRPDDSDELLAETVGRAGSEVELRIVDENRRPLPPGTVGEVAVRGPAVMIGYWNRPDETREAMDAEGWFHTGDLGELDEHGYLRLRGRRKEMYIRGGYNVYPVEVEAILARHPAVAAVAIVGVPDSVLGEKGLAVVVPADPMHPPSTEELRHHLQNELADYKAPDFVELRSELPLNSMYKVDKNRLREEHEAAALREHPSRSG